MKTSLRVQAIAAACVASWSALCCGPAAAADRIRLSAPPAGQSGSSSSGQSSGTITEISPTELVIELGSTRKKFAVNEVESVTFDDEPTELSQGRAAALAGRYDEALARLSKVNAASIKRKEIATDVEFYKAYAAARQALAGGGSVAEAGRQMLAFETAHPTSYHYFLACQTLGDLLASVNRSEQAEKFYAKLGTAPWPEYKARSNVMVGRALVAQKQFDRALAKFDEVLSGANDKTPDSLRLAAALGKASAMAGAGKTDEAVRSVEEIIAKADAEDQELHARAYIVLGNCHKAANRKKEALLAFLHVDLLYPRFAEQHAEALANLATLWAEVNKADRAAQAKATLEEKYPASVWAQK